MATWLGHLDAALDHGRSQLERVAAQNTLVLLLRQSKVSVFDIVLHMGAYLTTTDYRIRQRAMTLLGELVSHLQEMPLEGHVVHSLALFFIARMGDSAVLHGAVLGCLALLRRQFNLGTVSDEDILSMLMAFQAIHVQSFPQEDRMLCFQLLECITERHSSAFMPPGFDLVALVTEAIDGEKDPRCLLLAFHLVKLLGGLYTDPGSPLEEGAFELFDNISCYFPISFTLRPSHSKDISKEALITGLQEAFGASPFFASECIPFLLEKLSSSLQNAKLQSLRFLGYCTLAYGANVMDEYTRPIWVSLKAELVHYLGSSSQEQDPEVFNAANLCLQHCIKTFQENGHPDKDGGVFLKLLLEDEIFSDLMKYLAYHGIIQDAEVKQHIRNIGQVCASAARVSRLSNNIISRATLPVFLTNTSPTNYDVLEVVTSVLRSACEVAEQQDSKVIQNEKLDSEWLEPVFSSMEGLFRIFTDGITCGEKSNGNSSAEQLTRMCVAGLEYLATLAPYLPSLSEFEADKFVWKLLEIVLRKEEYAMCWNQAVQSIASVCKNHEKFPSVRNSKVSSTIAHSIVDQAIVSFDASGVKSFVSAINTISKSSSSARDMFVNEIEKNFSLADTETLINGTNLSSNNLVVLLHSFAVTLPSLYEGDDASLYAACLQLASMVWYLIGMLPADAELAEEVLMPLMELVRATVSMCDVEGQNSVLLKALGILFARAGDKHEGILDSREKWLIALFSAIVVAVRPNPLLQNLKLVKLLLVTYLEAELPARVNKQIAESLASLVNKWSTDKDEFDSIIKYILDTTKISMRSNSFYECRSIELLAWIAKGLATRGDNKISEIVGIFLKILENHKDENAKKSAAEGLHIIVKDADALNKKHFATLRPLYKQKIFSSFLEPFQQAIRDSKGSVSRAWLVRGFCSLVQDVPSAALVSEANMVFPLILEGLSNMPSDSDMLHGNLLVLSSFLVEETHAVVLDHLNSVATCLATLIRYRQSMAVRQTAVQCVGAMVGLPYASVYPLRKQALKMLEEALDDPKRAVRMEAARCYQAWQNIKS